MQFSIILMVFTFLMAVLGVPKMYLMGFENEHTENDNGVPKTILENLNRITGNDDEHGEDYHEESDSKHGEKLRFSLKYNARLKPISYTIPFPRISPS